MARTYADLYERRAEEAVARLEAEWPALARSLFLRNQLIRVTMTHLRATARLARGSNEDVRFAAGAARSLGREGVPWASALAELVLGCVDARRGDTDRAAGHFAAASLGFEEVDMTVHAACSRYALSELREGDPRRVEAERAIVQAGVRDPQRWVRMLAPGSR
jgi:hypothetical protein